MLFSLCKHVYNETSAWSIDWMLYCQCEMTLLLLNLVKTVKTSLYLVKLVNASSYLDLSLNFKIQTPYSFNTVVILVLVSKRL